MEINYVSMEMELSANDMALPYDCKKQNAN